MGQLNILFGTVGSSTPGYGEFHYNSSPWGQYFTDDTGTSNKLATGFESGTWTCHYWSSASKDITQGVTYSQRIGRYSKVGNLVYFWVRIYATSLGSLSGDLYIGGLPFVARTLSCLAINGYIGGSTCFYNLAGQVFVNNHFIYILKYGSTTGTSGISTTQLGTNADLIFSGFYKTSVPS